MVHYAALNAPYLLPRSEDVARILAHTPNAFSASRLDARPVKRPAVVEKTLREHGQKIRAWPREVGQIRLRLNPAEVDAEWQVELFNGAVELQELAQAG